MRLRDLDAKFLLYEEREDTWTEWPSGDSSKARQVTGMRAYMPFVESLAQAHGVEFLCPKCFAENHGAVGTHAVICWFIGRVPDWADPKPGRWLPHGDSLDNLTFVGPGAASVLLTDGCRWHGFVKNGDAS